MPKERKYPMPDRAHAANAKARATQMVKRGKLSSSSAATIRAKANRIFYAYEYPALQSLEAQGIVKVHFAKSQGADWMNPDDWSEGTDSSPPPLD